MTRIELWCDGAVKANGKPEAVAGWGVALVVDGKLVREANGHLAAPTYPPYQSNNTGELSAVIEGLKLFDLPTSLEVYSDSEYVIKGATQWHKNWLRNNWKNADGRPVANQKLWKELLEYAQLHDIGWHHVRGHTGIEWNERADQLAKAGVKKEIVDHLYTPMRLVLAEATTYVPVFQEYDEDDFTDF